MHLSTSVLKRLSLTNQPLSNARPFAPTIATLSTITFIVMKNLKKECGPVSTKRQWVIAKLSLMKRNKVVNAQGLAASYRYPNLKFNLTGPKRQANALMKTMKN